MDDEGIDRVAQEDDRSRQRAERAVLDRAAVRIGLVPRRRPACRLQARESRPRLPLRHAREVVRTGEERRRKALCLRERAIVFGLEIAGQEAAAGRRHDLERARRDPQRRPWPSRRRTDLAPRRRPASGRRPPAAPCAAPALLGDRPAGPAEGRKSGAVIVGVPAGQISEGERLEPAFPTPGGSAAARPAERARKPRRRKDSESGSRPVHCAASVATSCQFGSRVPSVRANVHTSVTSTTASGLPSTTLPVRVAGHRDELGEEADRHLRDAVPDLDPDEVGLVDRDEGGLGLLAALVAVDDRALETRRRLPATEGSSGSCGRPGQRR